jgi:hypothetical protein
MSLIACSTPLALIPENKVGIEVEEALGQIMERIRNLKRDMKVGQELGLQLGNFSENLVY